MKKLFNLLLLFIVAFICLFSLQGAWLFHTYRLHSQRVEECVDSIFNKAVEEELDQRFLKMEKNIKENLSDTNVFIASFNVNDNDRENNNVVSQQFTMFQQLMESYNIHFNMNRVDSIFHLLLQSHHYPFRYQIYLLDSSGKLMKTSNGFVGKGFKTVALPIVNGEKVYAIVKISSPVVFRTMFAILSVSILIVLLIMACMIYGIRLFINQQHLNQLRENFTHALTHDMKTPLATIHSVLVQLKNGALDKNPDMEQKYCTIAIDQALNLQAVVNQILTLASIENKQLSLNKQTIHLPEMIQSLIDKFTIESGKTTVFQTSYNLGDGKVYADPFYLNNVISNLIDNAIKYSGKRVEINIECCKREKQVDICVKDNGFGISSTDQLKIFNRFERGAEIKRNRISGFGIGLNYVQQIIEAHEGTVTVLSREGIGSEFIITLPIY